MSRPLMRSTAAVFTLGLALGLAACSGSGSSDVSASQSSGEVFEFATQTSGPTTSGLTIKIPQGLKDAMGDRANELLVDSLEVTARPLDGAEYCAFDVKPTWVNGGTSQLKPPGAMNPDHTPTPMPVWQLAGLALTEDDSPELLSQLPSSPDHWGVYVADDASTLTMVTGCSVDEFDTDDDVNLSFPSSRGTTGGSVAWVKVTVMKDGTLTVRESVVDGYQMDSSGTWIAS